MSGRAQRAGRRADTRARARGAGCVALGLVAAAAASAGATGCGAGAERRPCGAPLTLRASHLELWGDGAFLPLEPAAAEGARVQLLGFALDDPDHPLVSSTLVARGGASALAAFVHPGSKDAPRGDGLRTPRFAHETEAAAGDGDGPYVVVYAWDAAARLLTVQRVEGLASGWVAPAAASLQVDGAPLRSEAPTLPLSFASFRPTAALSWDVPPARRVLAPPPPALRRLRATLAAPLEQACHDGGPARTYELGADVAASAPFGATRSELVLTADGLELTVDPPRLVGGGAALRRQGLTALAALAFAAAVGGALYARGRRRGAG